MKKLLTLPLFLLFNLTVIAQASFGVKVNGGVSKISDNGYNPQYESYKGYFKPSGQVGFFYNLPIRAHEVFGIELLFTQIESKEKIVDTVAQNYNNYLTLHLPLSQAIPYQNMFRF